MDILLLILRLTLAGLLYAFLGAVLLMLWRDLRGEGAERSSMRPQGRLVVLEAEVLSRFMELLNELFTERISHGNMTHFMPFKESRR